MMIDKNNYNNNSRNNNNSYYKLALFLTKRNLPEWVTRI